jgi:hypothetical protein
MPLYKNKPFLITGLLLVLTFACLFTIRLGLLEKFAHRPRRLAISELNAPPSSETWMNIFQNNRRIGLAHTRLTAESGGYQIEETVHMRINTMGMVQDIHMVTRGRLHADFSLANFDFEITSGRFRFQVHGAVTDKVLSIETASAGSRRKMDIVLEARPYLLAGIISAMGATRLRAGNRYVFDVFDPATLGQAPVILEVIGPEEIPDGPSTRTAVKVAMKFKGITQFAWIDKNGGLLKEEGILGIRMEKTSRRDIGSRRDLEAGVDLTRTASIASNVVLNDLKRLTTLRVQFSGIAMKSAQINGGRQHLKANVLTIRKESLAGLDIDMASQRLGILEKIYLKPTPFIQSNSPEIRDLARRIVANHTTGLDRMRSLVDWVNQHIEKRPVLSLPDALSTLENRVGDCNEHAVLLAALARAAGIPCRIEAGLVYLQGRFYYHAWNRVYLGRWITVDALFNQIPADVSHIRLVTGSARQQLDLMAVIGRISLKVLEYKE